jgi:thiol-disulfide isomerase/thioredoxin
MFNIMYKIFLLFVFLISCSNVKEDAVRNEDSAPPSNGIVSEDPPGADDWAKDTADSSDLLDDPDSSDSDTSDSSDEPDELSSREGCSNEISWTSQPDPLNHPCNFRLQDQNGDSVELYDFQGDVIMLDFSTLWCGVCKRVAEHVQDMHDSYDPFSIITILTEDNSGNRPDISDLRNWALEYGITTSSVLAGTDELLGEEVDQWSLNGIPCFFVIDKNFYLRKMHPGWNEEAMTGYIESLILE